MSSKTLSMIIPVYYNAESLPILYNELINFEQSLAERNISLDLIFVDDGSCDDSFAELMKIKHERPSTKLIKLARNFGAVAAGRAGLRYVEGDCFLMLSADLQEPIGQVLKMVDCWLAGDKFVISARESRKDPPLTKLFAALYYRLLKWLVLGDYPQGGFDLMLMDKSMLPFMVNSGKNTNPNLLAYWLGFHPTVLHYQRQGRKHGKSRWTFRKKVGFLINTVTGFSVAPIRIMSGIGIATSPDGVNWTKNPANPVIIDSVAHTDSL